MGEKWTLLNNVLRRKAIWIGHIQRINCLLLDAIEVQMTEVKGVGRRRTQPLDDLRNRRRNWELKEEAEDRKNGDDSLSIEHMEEKHVFRKSMDLLISSILNKHR